MSRVQSIFSIILAIIALVLIGFMQTDNNANKSFTEYHSDAPTYQTGDMVTLAYEPTGKLGYKLISDNVKHYADNKDTWFTNPIVTIFSKDTEPDWIIKAQKAKLTNNKQLYLYGQIELDNQDKAAHITKIETEDAHVDLISQDITSDSAVTLSGPFFHSTGLKMKGNLRERNAHLLDKVITNYMPPPSNNTSE